VQIGDARHPAQSLFEDILLKKSLVETFSKIDLTFLLATALEGPKAIRVESIKSGLTERGVRRAIRQAIKRGHVELARLLS
jgi:hypothetical protein